MMAVAVVLASGWKASAAAGVSLLAPEGAKSARLAAGTFADLWEKVTDERPPIVSSLPDVGAVVVFGE